MRRYRIERQNRSLFDYREAEPETAPQVEGGWSFAEACLWAVGALFPSGLGGSTEYLADYLDSDAPLTPDNRHMLATLLRDIPEKGVRGNPYNRPDPDVRWAARFVRDGKAAYRQRTGRAQVPKAETDRLFEDAIRQIAERRGAPISENEHFKLEGRILNALQAQRF